MVYLLAWLLRIKKLIKRIELIYLKYLSFVINFGFMTYIVIDTSNKQAESFLEYVKTLSFAKIETELNSTTLKAMDSAKKGKTTKHKNAKELISFLNK